MNSERSAFVIGAPTHPRVNVFTPWSVWRVLARRMIKNNWPPVCTKQVTKILDLSRTAKKQLFFRFGGYRRTPPASSRLLEHGSTRYLRGRHLYSLDLPVTERVGRGPSLCRDRASIVARADFISVLTFCKKKQQIAPPAAVRKKTKNIKHFFPFFPFFPQRR